MRIAYLISAYTDLPQLMRTMDALDSEDSRFFVHIDRKSTMTVPPREHLNVLEKRFFVQWGGWNQVLYQQALLEACMNDPAGYDRIVLISGQDYPLLSPEGIAREFRLHPDRQYVKGQNISAPGTPERGREKITVYHFFRDLELPHRLKQAVCGGSRWLMRLLPIRKKPYLMVHGERWDVYQASSYLALTGACARYVLEQMRRNRELMSYFRHSFIPEELVIPTILFHSPYREGCEEVEGGYLELEDLSALTYFHYGEKVSEFRLEDYDELIASGKMFARKMRTGVSDTLMDRINALNRIATP